MGICVSKNSVNTLTLDNLDDTVELFSLEEKTFQAKIVRVYDGDTCFAVFFMNNLPVKFKIRMEGYDSPELKPSLSLPNREKEIKKANEAKKELEKLVLNKIVRLECGTWDKYGRLLGKLYVKQGERELYVNEHMIKNGHGYSYYGGTKKVST